MPRVIYMSAGAKPEQLAFYADMFKKVSESPEWKDFLAKNALNGRFGTTEAVGKYVAEDIERATAVFSYAGWLLK